MRRTAVFLLTLVLCAGCRGAGTPDGPPPERTPTFRDGEAALLLEDYAAAEQAFTQALKASGEDGERAAEASYWVGVCRHKRGNTAGARAAFARALTAANPQVALRSRMQLGELAWEAGEWHQSREMYSAAAADPAALTTDELLHARWRAARAAFRAGDWNDGHARLERWGPSDETAERALVRHVAGGGQFACVLGPFAAVEAERRLGELGETGRSAEPWSRGDAVWLIVRPFDDWSAAHAEAMRWTNQRVPARALP